VSEHVWSYREEEGQALLKLLYENPEVPVSVDTETSGLKVATGKDHCIGVSIATLIEGRPYSHYFAFAHAVGQNCDGTTLQMLKWVLEQGDHLLIFANVQFDILSLDTIDIHLDDKDFIDICTMAHLVNENKPYNKGVDSLAQFYLGEPGKINDKALEAEKKTGWKHTTPEEMWEYAVMDAVSTYRIWYFLKDHKNWTTLPEDIWPRKQALIRGPLLNMKRRGAKIDIPLTMEWEALGAKKMEELKDKLGMNPNSNKQMQALLLGELGLPVLKTSKKTGAPSFTKEVMEEYDLILERMDDPRAKLIKEYRGWSKTVTATYRPYLRFVDEDGRVRCDYKPHGTVTGRFSCSEPNLQQIPKTSDKPWNGKVKECFIAEEGNVLINADFSQLELRLATAYAGEERLKQVFLEGRDIFTEMSEELRKQKSIFTRDRTKTFVYSTQYGAGPPRIMNAFGVEEDVAKELIAHYYATYPKFRMLNERCKGKAESSGYVRLWSGRDRHFEYPKKEGYKAMNSVIQGGAADIVERIMVKVWEEIDNEDCQMLLQVHDSITFEVRRELAEEYMAKIKACMEDVDSVLGGVVLDVKFAVEVDYWVPQAEELEAA